MDIILSDEVIVFGSDMHAMHSSTVLQTQCVQLTRSMALANGIKINMNHHALNKYDGSHSPQEYHHLVGN